MNKRQTCRARRLLTTTLVGLLLSLGQTVRADRHLQVQQYMELMGHIIPLLESHYVDTIDWDKAMDAGINAMLYELDPYTEFYSEENQESWQQMHTGEYGGVGAVIQQHDSLVVIAQLTPDMPAVEAGLRGGDRLLAIDGQSMVGKTTGEVSEKLRGQPGTTVRVTYSRPYADGPTDVDIVRRKIVVPPVAYSGWVNDTTGYVKLTQFTDRAATQVHDALRRLRASGSLASAADSPSGPPATPPTASRRDLKALILDLRGNGGGLLEEAVKIVSLFVAKGSVVVETKARQPEWNATYRTSTSPVEPDLRLAVLVDRGSASASEIVSGALQDMDRAVIVGERSFGKGLVQSSRTLPFGAVIKFTSAKYYIPSGRCIQAIDYSNRNDDGSVGRIPDSLTHVFHTASGRPVRDGGGILPDVAAQPRKLSEVEVLCLRLNHVFDFATRYRNTHGDASPGLGYRVDDDAYGTFCRDVIEQTPDSLLRYAYVRNLAQELDSMSVPLRQALEQEVLSRYPSLDDVYAKSLQADPVVGAAVGILSDKKRYEETLKPQTGATPVVRKMLK